ncbi:ATP-dependent nuclease [Flavobacterium yafengii]|uniref:ATP-dependent nuclease n=1 Tax=Flavobacterium yafengii TaxID=3041253 RepID=UPI0024A8175A|nr:AAA family ATPase [Flavobacterium yafengii]MDI5899443.1 AAA family ATPase [Flavobacterium yafengii]
MRLEKIVVEDYKSIKKLEWDLNDRLTCLVGQNESGKSNVLDIFDFSEIDNMLTLDYKKHTRRASERYTNQEIPNISFYYNINVDSFHKFLDAYRPFLSEESQNMSFLPDCIIFETNNQLNTSTNFSVINSAIPDIKIPLFDISQFTQSQPDIFDFQTTIIKIKENIDLTYTVTLTELRNETAINTSLYKLLKIAGLKDTAKIPTERVQLKQYLDRLNKNLNKKFIKKYYTQDDSLNFEFVHDSGEIYLQIEDGTESTYSIDERSEGFKYYFNLLIEMATLADDDTQDIIFLLDEPGLRLHPSGQRDLLKYLEELSKKYRIIYTTHSPFLINRLHPNRVKIVDRDHELGTHFKYKGFSKNWKPMRSALGLNIKDSFYYSDKALIVEGPEDLIFISSLMNYFNQSGKLKINTDLFSFIDAGSESNLPSMVQIIIDNERPTLVLIDSDSTSTFNKLNKKVAVIGNREILDLIQVNEFNKDAVSIEDLMPSKILQQAVINYCSELLEDETFKLRVPEAEFKLDLSKVKSSRYNTAIANKVRDFYLEEGLEEAEWNKKSTPISKVGIARHFDNLLNDGNFDKKDIGFESSLKLVKKIAEKLALLDKEHTNT